MGTFYDGTLEFLLAKKAIVGNGIEMQPFCDNRQYEIDYCNLCSQQICDLTEDESQEVFLIRCKGKEVGSFGSFRQQ